nr:luciferin 4-monooxygenase isoform X1 [Aedes albopictus]
MASAGLDDSRFIISGGPVPQNVTEGHGSLGAYVRNRMRLNGNDVGLIDGVFGTELRYLELLEQTVRLAECLRTLADVRVGDVVGIVSENRLEFPAALFASIFLGATVAPINLTYTERELDHAFNLSKPKVIFVSPFSADRVVAVARQNRHIVQRVILFGDENPFGSDVQLLEEFQKPVSFVNPMNFYIPPVDVDNHVALIMCSSGTTGLPKGVQLTHYNLMASIALLNFARTRDESQSGESSELLEPPPGGIVLLGVLPWFHAYGCMTLINVVCNKQLLVSLPKFEEGLFLSCIENYRCTMVFVVPPLVVFLAKHPLVESYDLSSVDTLLCGAAPLSKETEDLVKERLKVRYVRQGYGMSETTLATLVQSGEGHKSGSVGIVQVGTLAKVIDPNTGRALGPNQHGELCFKGSQIMKGYIGNEKATKETIDKDGWLHTGDIGYYDEDHEFFIVDRLKELIKYKAYQVPPAELEAILLTNAKIKDAAVIGLPDENAGELPLAFVVKQEGVEISEDEIKKYVADRTSPAKRLHGGVRFIAEIPKNLSGKILRRELRALLQKPKSKL